MHKLICRFVFQKPWRSVRLLTSSTAGQDNLIVLCDGFFLNCFRETASDAKTLFSEQTGDNRSLDQRGPKQRSRNISGHNLSGFVLLDAAISRCYDFLSFPFAGPFRFYVALGLCCLLNINIRCGVSPE